MPPNQRVLDAFNKFDTDGNGSITRDELAEAWVKDGSKMVLSRDGLTWVDWDKSMRPQYQTIAVFF